MELIAIGFLLGVCVCFVIAGAGMYYADKMAGRNDRKDKEGDDDKNAIY